MKNAAGIVGAGSQRVALLTEFSLARRTRIFYRKPRKLAILNIRKGLQKNRNQLLTNNY